MTHTVVQTSSKGPLSQLCCCRLGCNHEFEGCTRRAPAFPEAITESPVFSWDNPHLKWQVDHIRVKVREQGRPVMGHFFTPPAAL